MLIRCRDTSVQSFPTSARTIFGVVMKRRVPAEKCSYRSIIKSYLFKAKDWSKRWVPATSNRCPDHLSRQFLTTASTFPYSSKNLSAEHITLFYTHPCVHEHEWVSESVFVMVSHVDKAWICWDQKFLELYRKVEAAVRNCLLRLSGHLVEVAGTPFPFRSVYYYYNFF